MSNIQKQCPNCSTPLSGAFCYQCGQKQKGADRYLWEILNEAFEGIFSWNSKAWLTTASMFFKPGFLTAEHFAGRRARYVSPLRLYIITSVGFFLTLTLINFFGNSSQSIDEQGATQIQKEVSQERETSAGHGDGRDGNSKSDVPNTDESSVTISADLPFISDDKEKELADKATKLALSNPRELASKIIDSLPAISFILLPLYALTFKLFFLKAKRYYAQHMVLALHTGSFFFAAYTIMIIGQQTLGLQQQNWYPFVFVIWSNLYLLFSLKRVFAQGWGITIVKSFGIGWIYFITTVLGLVMASIIGVILFSFD